MHLTGRTCVPRRGTLKFGLISYRYLVFQQNTSFDSKAQQPMIHLNGYHINLRRLFLFSSLALATFVFFACGLMTQSDACTNILVSRGASADGSVFVSFSVDGTGAGMLSVSEAGKKPVGQNTHPSIADYDGPVYKVLNHINEFQVSIGETTTNGRVELANKNDLRQNRVSTP